MSVETVDGVDESDLPNHWRELITPERWAEQTRDTSWGYFEPRVENMASEEHLVAALNQEVSRDAPREDRVATLNKRLSEVRE
jgi:hypothetical protein